MDEHFQWQHDQHQIPLKLFLEECNQLSAENHQGSLNLYLIQDWLADVETRAERLADRFRTQTHQPASAARSRRKLLPSPALRAVDAQR
jgi:hypothetical protein